MVAFSVGGATNFFYSCSMRILHLWYLLGMLLLLACQSNPPPPLANDDTSMVAVVPNLTAEERARANQVANRTLLQSVIDANAKLQRLEYPFSCSAQRGGLLVQLKDSTGVHSWRFARTEDQYQEVIHWYYRRGVLLLVVYEYSQWQSEYEWIEQTIFYTKKDSVLYTQRKAVQGTTQQLPTQLEQANLAPIPLDAALWTYLQTQEQRLRVPEEELEAWTAVWCKADGPPREPFTH